MDDLVSRQLAIATAISGRVRTQDGEDWIRVSEVRESLYAVPSIDAVKHGHWISTDDGWDGEYFVCSECGCPWTLIEGSPEENGMNFCPSCGARMDGEENG